MDAPVLWRLTRRGGYYPPALLWQAAEGDVGISPAGGWEWFRLRASSFCSGAKGTKRPPGAAHGHLQCPIPPPPDPLFFLRWSHQGARLYPSGAGKDQDTAPRAARYRSVLVELAYSPTRAIAPSFHPSRGGSVVAPPPWLVPDVQNYRKHAPAPGPHPPAVSSTAGPLRRWTLQVTVPRGVHPIGSRNGDPMEAQRSGFHWERTSDGMSEPCPLGRGEGYAVREDEVGRFKEGGFQRGEADSPYQGEMSRRDKGGRVLEIPPTFDGSLVTFCPYRKSLARRRNTLISFCRTTGRADNIRPYGNRWRFSLRPVR